MKGIKAGENNVGGDRRENEGQWHRHRVWDGEIH